MDASATFEVTPCSLYGDDRRLPGWRENVGTPIACDPAAQGVVPDGTTALTVLSWNLWIGRGRLREVVGRIRDGAYTKLGVAGDAPLVVLAQEAYRADPSVPSRSNGFGPREFGSRRGPQEDIVEVARQLGLSLRYAPSMRNGTDRSDRGNAILASCPIVDARAVELPLILERRVTVGATLELGRRRLLLLSTHLDPRGPPGHRWLGAAGRALQTEHFLGAIGDDDAILGADLNLGRGRSERSWRLLADAGFTFGMPPALPS